MPTVREVLTDPAAFNLRFALYADKPRLALDADCLILDPDDVEDEDDPEEARAAAYQYVLMMNDVDGIVGNLLDQVSDPPDSLRFDALKFYLGRDAYIAV